MAALNLVRLEEAWPRGSLIAGAPEKCGRGADCERGQSQQQQHKEAPVTNCLAERRHLGRNVRAPARTKPAASGEGEHLAK